MKLSDIAENQHLVREPKLASHVMLKDGFYMDAQVLTHGDDGNYLYRIHRLLDDDVTLAFAGLTSSGGFKDSWIFRRNVEGGMVEHEPVSEKNLHSFLKFKWWVWNKLISSGVVTNAKQVRRESR